MFRLKLFDRKGIPLNFGDIVKISNGREFGFYAEVTYLHDLKLIAPFHTFSFHSFEKVDVLPDNAIKATGEERYNVWYTEYSELDSEQNAVAVTDYLIQWRECEGLIEQGIYQIEPICKECAGIKLWKDDERDPVIECPYCKNLPF